MTNLESILKSRNTTLWTKVHLVKAIVLSVVKYECESWTIKKAEGQRIDAFELWCWRGLLRVPWTAKRSNQSIQREISPEDSLERLMQKLKFQSFGHLMRRADSLEKALMRGKIEGRRRRRWQRTRWLDGITSSMKMVGWHHRPDGHEFEQAPGDGGGQGSRTCCSPWGHKESDMTEQWNWTEPNRIPFHNKIIKTQDTPNRRKNFQLAKRM